MTYTAQRSHEGTPIASQAGGLTLAALGVVFGDIGTSPLYTLRVALDASGGSDGGAVLGILSLIFWALTLVITVKYVGFILGLDNGGEGGILALAARAGLFGKGPSRGRSALLLTAVSGAALMFGDAVITPAISVLNAIEGIGHWAPGLTPWVVPMTVAVLLGLFAAQRLGVSRISAVFGPLMLIWFATLALTGVLAIAGNPAVLAAIDPGHAARFAIRNPGHLIFVLAAVFLAVTGGEALYADLGQFGRRAITRAWLLIAFPALILNYFGQGALILNAGSDGLASPFYALFAPWAQVPAILLATTAAIIASQAVITGLFSLSRQAIKLSLLPPMQVMAMSDSNPHDVYLPVVNLCLMTLSITLAVWFGTSDALADAYGVSVAGAMFTTTVLFVFSLRHDPARSSAKRTLRWLLIVPIIVADLSFGAALSSKLMSGGALPVLLALIVLWISYSWRIGTEQVTQLARVQPPYIPAGAVPLQAAAVFLARSDAAPPRAMVQLAALAGVTFRQVLMVTVLTSDRPHVAAPDALAIRDRASGHRHITVRSGFLQRVNLPDSLRPALVAAGIDPARTTYVVGLERCLPPRSLYTPRHLQLYTYAVLTRLARRRADQFALPPERTLEIGVPWQL